MNVEIRYVKERNDGTGPKKHKAVTARALVGVWLCLLFMYATKGGLDTKLTSDHESRDYQPTPCIADSFLNFVTDQSNASQFFDKAKVDEWTRSVVAIGIHEPLVGSYSWYHRRTGFAFDSRHGGRVIVSHDVARLAAGQYRIHAHPFLLPPADNSHALTVRTSGVISYLKPHTFPAIPAVKLANLDERAYEDEFPVVMIGFEDGLPVHFYTHSVGPTDEAFRIQLTSRPYGVLGEFFGAPVLNTKGQVIGIYAPKDNKRTYLVASVLE